MSKILPDFDVLASFYPGKGFSADAVKQMVGGNVDQDHYENTCIIRISRPLNFTGHFLPRDDETGFRTKRGADKHWYGLRVDEFWTWMTKTYGPPFKQQKSPLNIDTFKGFCGIIGFRVNKWRGTGASGHFTLWDGSKLLYDDDVDYFGEANEAALWVGDQSRRTVAEA